MPLTTLEQRALENIASSGDVDLVRRIARNAKGKSLAVEKATVRRIAVLEAKGPDGSVESDCWKMVLTVEEIRRQVRGKKSPMNRLRPKIERDGPVASLEYLALKKNDGFAEVIEYGLPELTAEAIVIRHGEPMFSARAVSTARQHLQHAGYDPDKVSQA